MEAPLTLLVSIVNKLTVQALKLLLVEEKLLPNLVSRVSLSPPPRALFSRSWGRGERDPGNEVDYYLACEQAPKWGIGRRQKSSSERGEKER